MVLVGYDERHRESRDWYKQFFNSPTQCMVELGAPCTEPAIKGHVIPASRLRLIADDRNQVMTSILDLQKSADQGHISRTGSTEESPLKFDSRNIRNYLFTRRIACQRHDNDLFHTVEDREIDWNDPRSLVLITYRSLLAQIYIDRYTKFVEDRIYFTTGIVMSDPSWDRQLLKAKHELESMICNEEYDSWEFEVFQFEIPPAIAACGVTLRGFLWDEYYRLGNKFIFPSNGFRITPPPVIITVYPEEDKQSAVIAYPKWADRIVHVMIDALNQPDEFMKASMLSRTLLEETEIIFISI